MSSEDLLFAIGVQVIAYGGILIGTVALPVAASFLLDGIVQLLRGNGPKLFVLALVMAAVLAGVGYLLWQFGIGHPSVTPATQAVMATVAQYLLTISTVLALLGFVFRTAQLLGKIRQASA